MVDRISFELDGYLMKFQLGKPKVTFPLDRKRLYIKNIAPKTTEDGLTKYVEILTKKDVFELVRGKDDDAMITMKDGLTGREFELDFDGSS